jgi:hypothetical protein
MTFIVMPFPLVIVYNETSAPSFDFPKELTETAAVA